MITYEGRTTKGIKDDSSFFITRYAIKEWMQTQIVVVFSSWYNVHEHFCFLDCKPQIC